MAKLVPELYSSDINRSLLFYTAVLGFALLYERAEERFAYLELDGAQLMLEQPAGGPWLIGALEHPFGRGINLMIDVTDCDALHGSVRKSGAAVYLPPEERWYRRASDEVGQRQFIVQDPDGYLLRFCTRIGTRPLSRRPVAP